MLRNDKENLQVWFIKFYDMENDTNYLTYNMKGFKLHKLSVDTTNKGLVDTLRRWRNSEENVEKMGFGITNIWLKLEEFEAKIKRIWAKVKETG